MIRRRLLGLPLALLAACGKGPATTTVVTRDSAGVTIIEHSEAAVAASPLWRAGAPRVTIAHGATDDQTFSWIASAARLADGRIVVVDGQNDGSLVFIYAPDGKFERQIGRPGAGPGEFRAAKILLASDTLLLYDAQQARLTRMTTAGTTVGTIDLSRLGPMSIGDPAGSLSDGRLITTPIPFGDTATHEERHFRQVTPLLVVDPVAQRLDTLTMAIPGNEVFLFTMDIGGRSRTLPASIGYGRRSLLLPAGTALHVATNSSASVDTYTLPWTLRRSVRFAGSRRPVDDEARGAIRADAIANVEHSGMPKGPEREKFIDMINRAEIADSMAWYQAGLAGADGLVWLREMRTLSDSVPHFLVIGAEGKLTARMDLPAGSRLLWASADQVLISLTDADDVPRVELRPITKGSPTP